MTDDRVPERVGAPRRAARRCVAVTRTVVPLALLLAACAGSPSPGPAGNRSGQVVGRVDFVPGWDWSLFPRPDSAHFTPRPLADVRVSLRSCPRGVDRVGIEIAATRTDSLGLYRLSAAPGDYCLLLHAARHAGVLAAAALFPPGSEVSEFRRIRLERGATIEHDFEVHELVAQ